MNRVSQALVALLKLTPVALLAVLMARGFDILMAAPLALVYAVFLAMAFDRTAFSTLLDGALDGMRGYVMVFLILELAFATADAFMSSGVASSVIGLALKAGVTGQSVAVVGLLVTAVLSIATGTSWGTMAACAPIFLWLNHLLGGNLALTLGAIAGGACFGDNIGLISETTVVSSGIQGVTVTDRVRHQGVWSLLCLAAAAMVFALVGYLTIDPTNAVSSSEVIAAIPEQAWSALEAERPAAVTLLHQVEAGTSPWMVVPLVVVLALAVMGQNTLVCLTAGIASSLGCGLAVGTVTSVTDFLEVVQGGFVTSGSWTIVMMLWVGCFGGVMRKMNAFDPIVRLILATVRSVRQLMFANGVLCLVGNAALADEMAQIVTVGPLLRTMTEESVEGDEKAKYTLALRNATFGDAMGVLGSQLIPWHCYINFFLRLSLSVYPLARGTLSAWSLISHNYVAWIAVVSILLFTLTGLDRFVPCFALPTEEQVRLRNVVRDKK